MNKINLQFEINRQTIKRTDTNEIASNTIGLYSAQFRFDDTWSGLTKTAVFENRNGLSYEVLLNEEKDYFICDVAPEVLSSDDNFNGFMLVSVIGIAIVDNTVIQRATTAKARIEFYPGAPLNSINSETPTPTIPEQVVCALAKSQWLFGTQINGTGKEIPAEIQNASVGMQYINLDTSNVYKCISIDGSNSLWSFVTCFKGNKGDKGDKGEPFRAVSTFGQFLDWHRSISGSTGFCLICGTVTYNGETYEQGDIIFSDRTTPGEETITRYSIKGEKGANGDSGVTYTPGVSESGVISWTNDGGMENPPDVDLVGAVINALPSAMGVSF